MRQTPEDRWIKIFQEQPGAQLRLFCFPYAGGGASVFRLWSRELPAGVEVCAVQLPGRESRWREEPFRRLEPLADAAAEALGPHLGRPFAFFGHSLGAVLAFEVARRLQRDGAPVPLHLFVSGRSAPRAPDETEPIHDLPRDEFIEAVRSYSGTPDEVLANEELMELLEPLLRADFSVSETYEYRPGSELLATPVTVLGGVHDPEVPPQNLEGWRLETRGAFQKHLLDGGHFFLQERREDVLRLVSRALEPYLRS